MKILCFGDSNTYGYDPRSFWGERYPSEDRWVNILAGKLNCEAINAGENGREIPHNPWQMAEFQRLLEAEKTIDLLILIFYSRFATACQKQHHHQQDNSKHLAHIFILLF